MNDHNELPSTEKLTEDETCRLENSPHGVKALRLLDAATARVEAAERKLRAIGDEYDNMPDFAGPSQRRDFGETVGELVGTDSAEAAALRAQLKQAEEDQMAQSATLHAKLDEARQQRTEWALALNGPGGFRERLAAATALLDEAIECAKANAPLSLAWFMRRRSLSSTPAPSERAAAERRVLEACAEWRISRSEHGEDCHIYTNDQYKIAKAELALRAVSK